MLRLRSAAPLAILAVSLGAHTVPAQRLEYPWKDQAAPAYSPVKAGTTVAFRITQANHACFRYVISSKQIAAAQPATGPLFDALGASAFGLPALPPNDKTAVKAGAAPPGAPGEKALMNTPSLVPPSMAKADLDEIVRVVDSAYAQVIEATDPVDAVRGAREKAIKALDDFYATACGGPRGSADPMSDWTKARAPIATFTSSAADALKAVGKALARAKSSTTLASALLDKFNESADDGVADYVVVRKANKALVAREKDLLQTLGARIGDATALIPKLLEDAKDKAAIAAAVTAALPNTTEDSNAYIDPNSDQITITVKATRLHGSGDTEVTDVIPVPVHRQNRFFLTAGFMLSSLKEHSYDRASIIDSSSGKSYSTFVDRTPSSSVAFSPSLMAHMTVGSVRGIDIAGSAGVVMRSVSDKLGADFVLGPSVTIGDAVALTLSYHKGRVERLLLGSPDDVRKAPVPDTITRAGAVGQQWKEAVALVVSFKLPQ